MLADPDVAPFLMSARPVYLFKEQGRIVTTRVKAKTTNQITFILD